MRKVIQDDDTARHANGLHPPLDALEGAQAVGKPGAPHPGVGADGDRGEGVPDVVDPKERRMEGAEGFPVPADLEMRQAIGVLDVAGLDRKSVV